MLPRKYTKWVVLGVILILAVIGSSFFLSQQATKSTPAQSSKRLFPKEVAIDNNSNFKVLYRDPEDTVDRTVIYTSSNARSNNGSGLKNDPGSFSSIVGVFTGWQDTANPNKKYILLKDPIHTEAIDSVAIYFEPTSYLQFKKIDHATRLRVENISKARIGTDSEDPGFAVELTPAWVSDIGKILRVGDVVSIYTAFNSDENISIYDEEKRLIANTLFLRRTNGAADIEKEL